MQKRDSQLSSEMTFQDTENKENVNQGQVFVLDVDSDRMETPERLGADADLNDDKKRVSIVTIQTDKAELDLGMNKEQQVNNDVKDTN